MLQRSCSRTNDKCAKRVVQKLNTKIVSLVTESRVELEGLTADLRWPFQLGQHRDLLMGRLLASTSEYKTVELWDER